MFTNSMVNSKLRRFMQLNDAPYLLRSKLRRFMQTKILLIYLMEQAIILR